MAMESYNRDATVPVFGKIRTDNFQVSGLYKSPRSFGKLVLRMNPLDQQIKRFGLYDRIPLYSNGVNVVNFTTAQYLFPTLQNLGLRIPGFDPNVRDDAVVKCYGKIYEKVANVADIIRTRTEAVNMATNAIKDLHRAYKAVRRGKIHRASQILGTSLHSPPKKGNEAGGRWLEYSYGWSPLVQDVYNILDKGFGDIQFIVSARSKDNRQNSVSYSLRRENSVYHQGSGNTLTLDRARCTAKISIANTAKGAISSWGLDNPAALAWEALPYSFVIDWFYPIGDYLNDCMNLSGPLRISEMSVTEVTETTLNGHGDFRVSNTAAFVPGNVYYSQRYKRRKTGVTPRPLPHFNNPFTGLGRFWNQLALFKVTMDRR